MSVLRRVDERQTDCGQAEARAGSDIGREAGGRPLERTGCEKFARHPGGQARHTPDRLSLVTGLGLCLLAARAEALVCIDGVYNAFQDGEGLRAECVQGRDMGLDGKSLIHTALSVSGSTVSETGTVFAAPSPSDIPPDVAWQSAHPYTTVVGWFAGK